MSVVCRIMEITASSVVFVAWSAAEYQRVSVSSFDLVQRGTECGEVWFHVNRKKSSLPFTATGAPNPHWDRDIRAQSGEFYLAGALLCLSPVGAALVTGISLKHGVMRIRLHERPG